MSQLLYYSSNTLCPGAARPLNFCRAGSRYVLWISRNLIIVNFFSKKQHCLFYLLCVKYIAQHNHSNECRERTDADACAARKPAELYNHRHATVFADGCAAGTKPCCFPRYSKLIRPIKLCVVFVG